MKSGEMLGKSRVTDSVMRVLVSPTFSRDAEYFRLSVAGAHEVAHALAEHGSGQWRHVGDGSTRWIRLVLADDPESLLAAIVPCNSHGGAEANQIMILRRRNDPSRRSSRGPVPRVA